MHQLMPVMRHVLLGTAAVGIFFTTTFAQINDSIRGPANEANHFIETPKGWVHPKTPWGEPDIQAQLNMTQAAGVPLERCANSYRAALPPGVPNPYQPNQIIRPTGPGGGPGGQ